MMTFPPQLSLHSALWLGNLTIAVVLISLVALLAERLLRKHSLPTRHGILLSALGLTALSPLLITIAFQFDWGVDVPLFWIEETIATVETPPFEDVAVVASAEAPTFDPAFAPTEPPPAVTVTPRPPLTVGELLQPGEVLEFRSPQPQAPSPAAETRPSTIETRLPVISEAAETIFPVKTTDWRPTVVAAASWWMLLWSIGAFAAAFRLLIGWRQVQRLKMSLRPVSDHALQDMLMRTARIVGLNSTPRLMASPRVPVPAVCGLWRPVIVLPERLVEEVPAQSIESILLHECAHIQRRDLWVGWLQRVVGMLFWWNLPLRLIQCKLSDLREDLCDNHVLAQHPDGRGYARVLLDLVSRASGSRPIPASVGLVEGPSSGLSARITRLLKEDRNMATRLNRRSAAGLALLALIMGICICSLSLRSELAFADDAKADASESVADEGLGDEQTEDVDSSPTDQQVGPPATGTGGTTMINAPVYYDHQMLALVTGEGAAVVVFENVGNGRINYRWRYLSAADAALDSRQVPSPHETTGEGTLETLMQGAMPPIEAGPLTLSWYPQTEEHGGVTFNPELMEVLPLNRDVFGPYEIPYGELEAFDLRSLLLLDGNAISAHANAEYNGPSSPYRFYDDTISSWVNYNEMVLVVAHPDGVAAFEFYDAFEEGNNEDLGRQGVRYRGLFRSFDGSSESIGFSEAYEQCENGESNGGHLHLEAGPVHVAWSQGGLEGGWIYCDPNWERCWLIGREYFDKMLVEDANASEPALDLMRFRQGERPLLSTAQAQPSVDEQTLEATASVDPEQIELLTEIVAGMSANWDGVNRWNGTGAVRQTTTPYSDWTFDIDVAGGASLLTREWPEFQSPDGDPEAFARIRNQLVTQGNESTAFTRQFLARNGEFAGSGEELPGTRTLIRSERIEDHSHSDYVVDPRSSVSIGGTPLAEELAAWLFALEGDQGDALRQRATERFELRMSQVPENQIEGQRDVLLVLKLGDAAIEGGPPRWTAEVRLQEKFGWQPTFRELWRPGVNNRTIAERIEVAYESIDGHWLPKEWKIARLDDAQNITWEQTVEIHNQRVSADGLDPNVLRLENLGLRDGDQLIGSNQSVESYRDGAWQPTQHIQVHVPRTVIEDGQTRTVYEIRELEVGQSVTQVNPTFVETLPADGTPVTVYEPNSPSVSVPTWLSQLAPIHHFRYLGLGASREVIENASDPESPAAMLGSPFATDPFAETSALVATVDDPADAELQMQIAAAIDKAVEFLLEQQLDEGSWTSVGLTSHEIGIHSLALLGLLESGLTTDHDAVANALDWLREQENPEQTYDVALMIMAFAKAEGDADDARIAALVQTLQDGQNANGAWGYGGSGGNWWDNSNTQYAVLGMYAAHQSGGDVDLGVVRRSLRHYIAQQIGEMDAEAGSGWNYRGTVGGEVSGNMTAAGIASLEMLSQMLRDQEELSEADAELLEEIAPSIESGRRWLAHHFAVRTNPGEGNWGLCYLASLARVGELGEFEMIGDHDWYREGADFLIVTQNPNNGTWRSASENDPVIATSMALLFLSAGIAEREATAAVSPQEHLLVRFAFENAPWNEVIEHFGELTGTTVDIQAVPEGTFTFVDRRQFTLPQALGVLNNFLNQRGCVLLREGDTLIVMDADDAPNNPFFVNFPTQLPESPEPAQPPATGTDPFSPQTTQPTRPTLPPTVPATDDPFANPSSTIVLLHLRAADNGTLGELHFFNESLGSGSAAVEALEARLNAFKADLATRRQLFRVTAQITADQNLQYGAVISVIDACQSAGIDEIKLSTGPTGDTIEASIGFLRDQMGRRVSAEPILSVPGATGSVDEAGRLLQSLRERIAAEMSDAVLTLNVDSEIEAGVVQQVIQQAQAAGFEKFALRGLGGSDDESDGTAPDATSQNTAAPLLNGVVLAVDDASQLIEVSIGVDDGVKQHDRFTIYRREADGDLVYVGECEVVSLQPDRSAARILASDASRSPQVDDQVVRQSQEVTSERLSELQSHLEALQAREAQLLATESGETNSELPTLRQQIAATRVMIADLRSQLPQEEVDQASSVGDNELDALLDDYRVAVNQCRELTKSTDGSNDSQRATEMAVLEQEMARVAQQLAAIHQRRMTLAEAIEEELSRSQELLQVSIERQGAGSPQAEIAEERIAILMKTQEDVSQSLQQSQAALAILNQIQQQTSTPESPTDEQAADSRLLSLQATLIDLRAEEAELLQSYGENHPQVRQTRSRIESLEAMLEEMEAEARQQQVLFERLRRQLLDLKAQEAELLERLGANHPEVQALQRQIAVIEGEVARLAPFIPPQEMEPPATDEETDAETPSTSESEARMQEQINAAIGLTLKPVSRDDVRLDHQAYHGGLEVTDVREGSPAEGQGIRRGDILVGLHHWETVSLENVEFVLSQESMAELSPIKFYVIRDGETLYGFVPLDSLLPTGNVFQPAEFSQPDAEPATVQLQYFVPDRYTIRHQQTDDRRDRVNADFDSSIRSWLTDADGVVVLVLVSTCSFDKSAELEFLEHNAVPISITEDDIEAVAVNTPVTKVVYRPADASDSEELEVIVSTRLDPGIDPIAEATARGAVVAVVRLSSQEPMANIPFDPVTVNLNDRNLNRFLHVEIMLQIPGSREEEIQRQLETQRAELRNWMLSYLSDLTMDDLRGASGQNRIRHAIAAHFNSVLGNNGDLPIVDVMFEQFNVQ